MSEVPQFRPTGETRESIIARKKAQAAQQAQQQQTQYRRPQYQQPAPRQYEQPQPTMSANERLQNLIAQANMNAPQAPTREPQARPTQNMAPQPQATAVEIVKPKRRKLSRRALLWILSVGAGVTAAAVGANAVTHGGSDNALSNAGSIFHFGSANPQNIDIGTSTYHGPGSLDVTNIEDPESAIAVVTVSGDMALPPELANATNPNGFTAPKYIEDSDKTKEAINNNKSMKSSDKKNLLNHLTESGYPEATLNDMPFAVKVWQDKKSTAITRVDGKIKTVDLSQLHVSLEDITKDLGIQIKTQWQTKSSDVKTDPENQEYATLPTQFFVGESQTDDVWNKSVDALNTSYGTTAGSPQQQVILYEMEKEAAASIDHDQLTSKLTSYILKRIGANPQTVTVIGDLDPQVAVPLGTNKLEITAADPKTGAPALQHIAPADFKLDSVNITEGYMKEPKIKEDPTPTPTPSATPSAKPTENKG